MGYEIMDKLNLINKNIETCRLYGVDLEELLNRGSQFKVEAILSRVCKSKGYLLLSGSKEQISSQRTIEYKPIVI